MRLAVLLLIVVGAALAQTPLAISSSSIVDGYLGSTYGAVPQQGNSFFTIPAQPRYVATGGRGPYTFRIAAGALPSGMNLGVGGFVLGVPSATGAASFDVEVTDANNQRARMANQRITVQSPILISGFAWTVGTSVRFRPQCSGAGPYSYSISGTPPGVSLNGASGQFSGAPTAAGSFPGRWVCSSPNLTFTHDYVFTVGPMRQVPLNPTVVGQIYAFNPANALGDGTAPFEYSLSGELPPGLSMGSATTGLITGRPTQVGLFRFAVRRKDAAEEIRSLEFFLSVNAAAGFQLSTGLLKFEASQGSATSLTKALLLKGSPTGARFAVETDATEAPWLSVATNGETLPASAAVSVNPAELVAGTYEARIRVSSASGVTPALQPAEVAVQLIVRDDVPPKLVVDQESLQASAREGSEEASTVKLTLKNGGGGVARFQLKAQSTNKSDSLKWIEISPSEGDLKAGESKEISIRLSLAGLAVKTHSAKISITNSAAQALVMASAPEAEALDLPVNFIVQPAENPCPSVRLLPQGHWFESYPGGKAQRRESTLELSGGLPENRNYTLTQFPDDVRLVEISKGAFLGGSTIDYKINPSLWTDADGPFFYDIYGFFGGKCFRGLLTGAVLALRENAFPVVSARAVVLPARYYNERGLPGSFQIIPQSPAQFTYSIEVSRNPYSDTADFFSLNSTSGVVQGSEDGAATPVQINVIQAPLLPPKITYYSYQLKVTLTRKDGATWWYFVDVMQLVSVPPIALPVTPALPAPPGSLPLFSRSPLAARQTTPGVKKHNEACAFPGPQILPYVQPNFKVSVGREFAIQALVLDTCGQLAKEGTMRAVSSNDDLNLEMLPGPDGLWQARWIPRAGVEAIDISLEYRIGDTKNRISLQGEVVEDAEAPWLERRAFFNGVSKEFEGRTSPGALLSIRGKNLAGTTQEAGAEATTSIGDSRVLVDGEPARILKASPEEVLVEMPRGLVAGAESAISVRRGKRSSAPQWLLVDATTPAIFAAAESENGEAEVYRVLEDGSLGKVNRENPAKQGEALILVASGLGAVDEENRVLAAIKIYLGEGDVEAEVGGAVAIPARPGRYEIRFRLPDQLPSAENLTIAISAADSRSTALRIAVE